MIVQKDIPIKRVLELERSLPTNQAASYELGMIGRGGDGYYYAEAKTEASLQYLAVRLFNGESKSQNRKTAHKIERERNVNRSVKKAIRYFEERDCMTNEATVSEDTP